MLWAEQANLILMAHRSGPIKKYFTIQFNCSGRSGCRLIPAVDPSRHRMLSVFLHGKPHEPNRISLGRCNSVVAVVAVVA
jgi:hypothetical protein